jgi:pyridoxamine 5'-phosphate oxidase
MPQLPQLDPSQASNSQDPLALFDQWLAQAAETEPNDPNAAALATATLTGAPSVRMVLVKHIRDDGGDRRFCVFTNTQSRKGQELAQNPHAALCFHWKSLRRQVRVEGPITPLPAALSDAYFHSRSRASQIGANVSQQSRPLASRELLEAQVQEFTQSLPNPEANPATSEIPRPAHWQGFQIHPSSIEFWQDGPNRLHDRLLFTQVNGEWQKSRLYP